MSTGLAGYQTDTYPTYTSIFLTVHFVHLPFNYFPALYNFEAATETEVYLFPDRQAFSLNLLVFFFSFFFFLKDTRCCYYANKMCYFFFTPTEANINSPTIFRNKYIFIARGEHTASRPSRATNGLLIVRLDRDKSCHAKTPPYNATISSPLLPSSPSSFNFNARVHVLLSHVERLC